MAEPKMVLSQDMGCLPYVLSARPRKRRKKEDS